MRSNSSCLQLSKSSWFCWIKWAFSTVMERNFMSGTELLTHIASPTPLNDPPPESPKDQTKSPSLVVHFLYFSPLCLNFFKKAVHSQEAELFSIKKGILKQWSSAISLKCRVTAISNLQLNFNLHGKFTALPIIRNTTILKKKKKC